MTFHELNLAGLKLIKPTLASDKRGLFVKIYHRELFLKNGIDFTPKEEFYSVSGAGVLRGMHFQSPPSDYGKLVHCIRGRLYDVVLDLRKGSPTYGQSWGGELDAIHREALYQPPGFAHGFYSLEPDTIISYLVSHVHDPLQDHGILWSSFGHAWPEPNPILSERDARLPALADFSTPFQHA